MSGRIAHRLSIMSLAANNEKLYRDKNHMSTYSSYNVNDNTNCRYSNLNACIAGGILWIIIRFVV